MNQSDTEAFYLDAGNDDAILPMLDAPQRPFDAAKYTAATVQRDLISIIMRDGSTSDYTRRKMGRPLQPQIQDPKHMPLILEGVPIAATLTEAEIVDAIACDADPWSLDADETALPNPMDLPVEALLTTVELLTVLGDLKDLETLVTPGMLTLFAASDPFQMARLTDQSDRILSAINELPQLTDLASADTMRISTQKQDSRYNDCGTSNVRSGFTVEVEDVIAAGQNAVVICDQLGSIEDRYQVAFGRTYHWPQLTADMIIQLLKQTHSVTGQVAEAALVDMLPTATRLATIPTTLLCRAFRASSSIAVAKRLAFYATFEEPASDTLTLNDVKGLPEACAKMHEIIVDLEDWKAGRVAWSDISASALLFGPPGSGKTMMAEALAGSPLNFLFSRLTHLPWNSRAISKTSWMVAATETHRYPPSVAWIAHRLCWPIVSVRFCMDFPDKGHFTGNFAGIADFAPIWRSFMQVNSGG